MLPKGVSEIVHGSVALSSSGCRWVRLVPITSGRAALSGIELMKAAHVRGLEDALVRRALLRRAIGRTASENER